MAGYMDDGMTSSRSAKKPTDNAHLHSPRMMPTANGRDQASLTSQSLEATMVITIRAEEETPLSAPFTGDRCLKRMHSTRRVVSTRSDAPTIPPSSTPLE